MLREAESIYNEKFRGILALATYRDQITSARQKLQANISTQFQEKTHEYVIAPLNFIKNVT
jgi:hypothetical protein